MHQQRLACLPELGTARSQGLNDAADIVADEAEACDLQERSQSATQHLELLHAWDLPHGCAYHCLSCDVL